MVFLARLTLIGGWKLKGPNRTCAVVSSTRSAHWICVLLEGVVVGGTSTRCPYVMTPVFGSLVYLYQSGHHLAYSSLLYRSSGCLAKNTHQYLLFVL